MTNIPRAIHEAHISTKIDSAAGTSDKAARISADGAYLVSLDGYSAEDRQTLLEEFREGLAETFSGIWGERPRVIFDFELVSTT